MSLHNVCYFSSSPVIPSRDTVYLDGLRKNGLNILECRDASPGLKKFFALYRKHRELKGKYDLIFVGYSGHLLVSFAWLISQKPIVFNALAPLYEGMVVSRKRWGPFGLAALWYWLVDFVGFRCAALVLVETEAQKKYLQKIFWLPGKKFIRAWSGVDEKKIFFDPRVPKLSHFTVLFRGAFLPESGIQHAIEAAKILKDEDIRFRIIGEGMMAPQIEKILDSFDSKNVEWIRQRLSDDELRIKMQECHLSLGQLTDHPRLSRTTPFKAFESIAMKLPYLTARNKGILELLAENATCLGCNPADPEDLAQKILWAKNHPEETEKIAENGYQFFRSRLNSAVLARTVKAKLDEFDEGKNADLKITYLTSIEYPSRTVASPIQIAKTSEQFSKLLGNKFCLIVSKAAVLKDINYAETKAEIYKKLHLTTLFYFFWLIKYLWDKDSHNYIFYSRDQKLTSLLLFLRKIAKYKYKVVFEYHILYKPYLDRFISRNSDLLVTITAGLKNFLAANFGVSPNKIMVAPDGVDTAEFEIPNNKQEYRNELDLPTNKKIAGYVGTLSTLGMEKGIRNILLSAQHLESRKDIVFYIVGIKKSEINRYEQTIKKLGLKDKVKLIEYQPREQVPKYLKSFDVLLMTFPKKRHFAHFMSPLKMFEYMASDIPIITSDLPAIREVLSDDEAVFVDPSDSDGLSQAIVAILDNPQKSKMIAENAMNKVKNYTWDIRATRIVNFITPR